MRKFSFDLEKLRIRLPRLRLPDWHVKLTDWKSPRSKLFLVLSGVIGVIFVVAAGYMFWYTSQESFCRSCHVVKTDVDSWAGSIHAEVSCNSCHWPGILGPFKQKVSLARELYVYVTKSYEQPLNKDSQVSKHITSDACLQCHTPKRTITPRKTLIMNHNVHINKGINCTTCHNRSGHPDLPNYQNFISMDGCFRCHGLSKTAIAPGTCKKCHPPNFNLKPPTHLTGTWLIPDHPKAAKQNMASCWQCHQRSFCRGCHGVDVPHPDKFVKGNHGEIGKKSPQVCQKCHRQKDFCNACHHSGFTGPPGTWVLFHKAVVAQVGPAACFNCHGPTYCARCHVRN